MEAKRDIRTRVLQQRDNLAPEQRSTKSRHILHRLMQTEEYRTASFLYCYMCMRSEVMMDELIKNALEAGKRVAVPKIEGKDMDFYLMRSLADAVPGYMGIREPLAGEIARQPGLVIVPGAVFDRSGNRIGYGAGFYDRYFEKHPYHQKLGAAFDLQVVERLPADRHDIPVDMIITESEVIRCNTSDMV